MVNLLVIPLECVLCELYSKPSFSQCGQQQLATATAVLTHVTPAEEWSASEQEPLPVETNSLYHVHSLQLLHCTNTESLYYTSFDLCVITRN